MTNLERMRLAAANKPVAGEKKIIDDAIDKGKRSILKKATDQIVGNVVAQNRAKEPKGEVKPPPPPQQPRKKHKHRPLPLTPDERDQLFKRKHRLPNGAMFTAVYDAEAVMWSGTLYTAGLSGSRFTHSGPGLYRMLSELDDLYLATLKPAEEPEKEGEVKT